VPVGLVGVATGLFAFSVVSGIGAFMAVAIVLLALAAVAFVAAPLLMLRSRR
jgi:hypothetical protein